MSAGLNIRFRSFGFTVLITVQGAAPEPGTMCNQVRRGDKVAGNRKDCEAARDLNSVGLWDMLYFSLLGFKRIILNPKP